MWCIIVNGFEVRFGNPLLLLSAIPALVIVWLFWRRGIVPGKKRKESVWPLLLRMVSILLAAAILAEITVVTNRVGTEVLIAADVSDSMKDAAAEVASDVRALSERLGRGAHLVSFAGEVRDEALPGKNADGVALKAPENGEATDLARILTESMNLLSANAHGRVVLLTDGLQTSGDALAAAHTLAN